MDIEIRGEYITLGQLLQAAGAASSGGDAKRILADGGVTANGKPEDRRGRKLRPGDVVEVPAFGVLRLTGQAGRGV